MNSPMTWVLFALVAGAFVVCIIAALKKAELWIAVMLLCIAVALTALPGCSTFGKLLAGAQTVGTYLDAAEAQQRTVQWPSEESRRAVDTALVLARDELALYESALALGESPDFGKLLAAYNAVRKLRDDIKAANGGAEGETTGAPFVALPPIEGLLR